MSRPSLLALLQPLRDRLAADRALNRTLAALGWLLLPGALLTGALSFLSLTKPPPAPEERPPPPALPALAVAPSEGRTPSSCQIVVEVDAGPAEIALYRVGIDRTLEVWTARPGASGAHRFIDLPAGTYHVNARVGDRPIAAAPVWTCEGRGERAYFAVAVPPAGERVSGRVLGHEGRPAGAAELLVAQPEGSKGAVPGVLHVPLAPDGSFSFALVPGAYKLLATAPHHTAVQQDLQVRAGEPAATGFFLKASPRLQGRVVDAEGAPVPNAEVSLGAIWDPKVGFTSVVADREGRYELPIPLGQPLVVVARGGGRVGRLQVPAVSSIAGRAGVDVVVLGGRSVEGFVLTQRGEAHAFAPVRFRVRSYGLVGAALTDAEGRFLVEGLPAGEDVELWAEGSAVGAWGAAVAAPDQERVLLTWVPPAY